MGQTTFFDRFFDDTPPPPVTFSAKFWGYNYRSKVVAVFGSNVPLALAINSSKSQVFPLKEKKFPPKNEANFRQNRPKFAEMSYALNAISARGRARGLIRAFDRN